MKSFSIDITNDTVLNPKFDKRTEVFKWGLTDKDNQLPSIIQYLASESVTVKSCISRCLDAVLGKGFTDGKKIVGDNRLTINKLHRQTGREVVTQSNAFIHVRYDGSLKPKLFKLEPSPRVRIGRKDDLDYSGKFLVTDWQAKRITKDKIKVIDKFNSDRKVVAAQVLKSLGLKPGDEGYDLNAKTLDVSKYKGQILHITKDSSLKYAPSDMNSILEDAETEINSKKFSKNNSGFGFMNAKLVLTGKMTEDEERAFTKDLKAMQGSDNASNLLVYQATNPVAELDKQVLVKDLASNPNDKVLNYSDTKSEANICKAFTVPVALVSGKSEGIFGNSGEALTEMKKQLYASREYDRMLIEEAFRLLLGDEKLSIIDPFEDVKDKEETPVDENLKAQATLRGSVGGVTALLSIQQSVAENKTTVEQAIAMVMNIFGFSEDVAKSMIGSTTENTETE